jgi:hypothetical protein
MPYRAIWLVGSGYFFGSILGRDTAFGHWVTVIAAVAMLIGIFGDAARKTKPSISSKEKHDQTH